MLRGARLAGAAWRGSERQLARHSTGLNAPIGQYLTHFRQPVHLSPSMSGRPTPCCDMAPTGQTLMDGHGWFWGQRSLRTVIFTGSSSRSLIWMPRNVRTNVL